MLTKTEENQVDWQIPHLQSSDRVLETLIKKNASLERRVKELEVDFAILCVALSIASAMAIVIIYLM